MSAPSDSAASPFEVRFYAVVGGNPIGVVGMRVGHFLVRRGNLGEVSNSTREKVDFVVQYLAPGHDTADPVSINFGGHLARARALFVADELSRHLVVDDRGFKACASEWPGFSHLVAQDDAILRGELPVPWHHTEQHARWRAARTEAA